MTRIIMGARPSKRHTFSRSSSPLGTDGPSMRFDNIKPSHSNRKLSLAHLKKIASSFILFDWEFFSNELEYE
ncbi:MAG: hypothetical protein AAB212_09850 [Bacteroidota bacterium]